MASLSDQLEEVRLNAEGSLCSPGSAQEIRSGVSAMANIPLPPTSKYRHIAAESMLKENSSGNNRKETMASLQKLSTALNILEKYGSNLTNSNRPKYWRTVKYNNPVFRTTVDSIQGGRAVLNLYGYTNQQPDGLSFPDDVVEPDAGKVASVTLEVMCLRMELDMLTKGAHSHPEFYERLIPSLTLQDEEGLGTDAVAFSPNESPWEKQSPSPASTPSQSKSPFSPSLPLSSLGSSKPTDNCSICGISPVSAHCPTCTQRLCKECDQLYHSHSGRSTHVRIPVTSSKPTKRLSSSLSTWQCLYCTTVNTMQQVLCETCERPRLSSAAPSVQEEPSQPSTISEWQCKSCTVVNAGSSILCEVCERPRLATRPPVAPSRPAPTTTGPMDSQWVCLFCTYVNQTPSAVCEMCYLSKSDHAPYPSKPLPVSPVKNITTVLATPKVTPTEDPDLKRQRLMKEEGIKLIQLIREGEKKGVSPEEVYTSMCVSGNSNVTPYDWLKTELPHVLDEICVMAASCQQESNALSNSSGENESQDGQKSNSVPLSRAEAKRAWLAAGGDNEKAVRQAHRARRVKVKELGSLGFNDVARCEEALRQSGGEVRGALVLLQRSLLDPFHQRMWTDEQEPPIDINHPDKQHVCRRLLAVYDLPSWGRCELALSLLRDPTASYTLEDVVQAVRESPDKDFIRRVLNKECPICLSIFPQSKMQSLTSCQCSVCCGCFKQHFTIAVRDKHIRDMVCPVCAEPDINDPEHLNSYFSTLDIQLRDCLELEVYELFHKKLTEQALIKDPKFLWCSHCSYGFIYVGDQLKVTCLQCRKSFCAQCKKPWEDQHKGVSCEQFQLWKRENDPDYQRQGLAGYLRDNGITCPNCRFQYALARGGCMHFSCSQCRYQFCSGCNNPFHTTCAVNQCSVTGLHAHHPRDCLFYLRDWEPARLQALLQKNGVKYNTDTAPGTQTGVCGVIEQKDEGPRPTDSACGAQTQPGQAGLCEKHYREYLVSLINGHSLDPAPLFNHDELLVACRRYHVDIAQGEGEDDRAHYTRLLKKLMDDVPLGDKVPRKK
ncbi:E3 ubiquitin-protein ligase RNF31 isoform X2 [Triplophysa rosa]|uniref:E3 ubiquitin-protein ligase RNF31 n=1 Tax=Triplophysa rosa TaxID=992332 RepID=A0A9W8C7V8_TRIRA|nr:E3 ubiquitin-protein ligase RNF31 isoform X2 [Triplophysa rosa]KAI7809639.1 putative E3 ubiquitin-protein ligase RNF31 [Triplophysa rosa]